MPLPVACTAKGAFFPKYTWLHGQQDSSLCMCRTPIPVKPHKLPTCNASTWLLPLSYLASAAWTSWQERRTAGDPEQPNCQGRSNNIERGEELAGAAAARKEPVGSTLVLWGPNVACWWPVGWPWSKQISIHVGVKDILALSTKFLISGRVYT